MDWINTLKEPLLAMDLPENWVVQLGPNEAFRRKKSVWETVDPSDVFGRMLENEEIKIIPKIGDLSVVIYFIPRTTLVISDKAGAKLARHITITMRPYYMAKNEEDAVDRFWKEYGRLVGVLETMNYELREQDVDFIDDSDTYNYFVDTSFWKFLGDRSKDEVAHEIFMLLQELGKGHFIDEV